MKAGSAISKNGDGWLILSRSLRKGGIPGVGERAAKSLSYWSTKNGDDTMVTLWNPADEAQDFVFTLLFSGGHYQYPIHMEPRATHTFNVSEVVHSQTPDDEGNVVPIGVQEGSAEISGRQGESESILVASDFGIYNVRKATCSSGCTNCAGAVEGGSAIVDDPFALAVAGTHQLSFQVTWSTGGVHDYTASSSWTSHQTSVGTVSAGLVHGVAPGSVTITTFVSNVPQARNCDGTGGSGGVCPKGPELGSGGGTVQVPTSLKVLNVNPLQTGSGGCKAGYYGIEVDIQYQVLDQSTPPLPIQSSAMTPQEYIVWYDGTNNGGYQNFVPPPGTTNPDGTFHDTPVGLCKAVPFNTPLTSTQTIRIVFNGQNYQVRTNNWKFSSTNLINHGTVTNGGDVNATQ